MKKIFVLTGEPSGDKLASTVVTKLQQNYSDIDFFDKICKNKTPYPW